MDAGNGRTGASAWQPGGGEEHRVLTLCRRKEESEFEAACVCAIEVVSVLPPEFFSTQKILNIKALGKKKIIIIITVINVSEHTHP